MSLRDDKKIIFETTCDDKEVLLRKIPEKLSSCWIYDGGVVIDPDILMIVRHNDRYPEYNSTVVYIDKIPVATNQTTSLLMKDYTKQSCVPIKVLKYFCYHLDGKDTYKLPSMSPESCFIPLEGRTGKEPDFTNLALVDNFYKYDKYHSVVKYCNGFKKILPIQKRHLIELADKYLRLYAIYFSCDNEHQIDIFSKWRGCYYQKREVAIGEAIKYGVENDAKHIKMKANFKYLSTEEDQKEIINDFYDNN